MTPARLGLVWSPEEDSLLLNLRPGYSLRQVADQLGRTSDATHTRLVKLRKRARSIIHGA